MSDWAICLTSAVSTACSNAFNLSSNSAICSFVIFSLASCTAKISNASRTCKTSSMSFSVMAATSAPLLGIVTASPSCCNIRIASRIGVRLTPSFAANCNSINRSPGFRSPLKIASRKVLKTTSLNGRYSLASNFKFSIVPPFFLHVHLKHYALRLL